MSHVVQGDGPTVEAWTLRLAACKYILVLQGWRRQWGSRPAMFFYSSVFQGAGQMVGAWTWRPAVFFPLGMHNLVLLLLHVVLGIAHAWWTYRLAILFGLEHAPGGRVYFFRGICTN